MKRRRAEAMEARHVKEGGTFGGKRKTVRAEDGGEVRRRLNARQGGRVLTRRWAGRMREVRMSRVFANGEQGDADSKRRRDQAKDMSGSGARRGLATEGSSRCESSSTVAAKFPPQAGTTKDGEGRATKHCRMCTCCTGTSGW